MAVGINCAACSFDLTPPIACLNEWLFEFVHLQHRLFVHHDLKEKSSVGAGKGAEHILLQPDRLVPSLPCCSLLAVENTLHAQSQLGFS